LHFISAFTAQIYCSDRSTKNSAPKCTAEIDRKKSQHDWI
jgi:hypothetical protein